MQIADRAANAHTHTANARVEFQYQHQSVGSLQLLLVARCWEIIYYLNALCASMCSAHVLYICNVSHALS
jgi:hypothetical protein